MCATDVCVLPAHATLSHSWHANPDVDVHTGRGLACVALAYINRLRILGHDVTAFVVASCSTTVVTIVLARSLAAGTVDLCYHVMIEKERVLQHQFGWSLTNRR